MAPERCTRSSVLTAVRRTRFLSSLQRAGQSTARSAGLSTGRREGTRKLGRASSATGFRDRLRILFFFRFIHYILGRHVLACVYIYKVVCIKVVIFLKREKARRAQSFKIRIDI